MATRSHAASASGASGEGGRSLDSARLPLRLSRSALSEGCEVARCSEGWAGLGALVLVLIEFFARASEAAPTLLSFDSLDFWQSANKRAPLLRFQRSLQACLPD